MFYISETMRPATCGGCSSRCDTYKDHPDWEKIKKQGRQIPQGEMAFYVDKGFGKGSYCLCYKHAPAAIAHVKAEIIAASKTANKLGWEKAPAPNLNEPQEML